jgi:hypothetical protein
MMLRHLCETLPTVCLLESSSWTSLEEFDGGCLPGLPLKPSEVGPKYLMTARQNVKAAHMSRVTSSFVYNRDGPNELDARIST